MNQNIDQININDSSASTKLDCIYLNSLSENEFYSFDYTKELCEKLFRDCLSEFVNADILPLIGKSKVTYKCRLCKNMCTKEWSDITPTLSNRYIKTLCKKCAMLRGKEDKIKNQKMQKQLIQKKVEEISKNIKTGEKYCYLCDKILPIKDFKYRKHAYQTSETCVLHKKTGNGNIPKYTKETVIDLFKTYNIEVKNIKNITATNNITTKSKITFNCTGYNCTCGNEATCELFYAQSRVPYCENCRKMDAKDRHSKASTGVTRTITNKNPRGWLTRRKYTIEDIKRILAEQGAELIEDQLLNDKLGTKDTVLFRCAEEDCLNIHERAIRDFDVDSGEERAGPYCIDCTQDRRSQKISIKATRVLDPITDPLTQQHCPNCKNIRSIQNDFNSSTSTSSRTLYCLTCRNKSRLKYEQKLFDKINSVCNDPSKQKCKNCFGWKELSDFENNNITCRSVCRSLGTVILQNHVENICKFNESSINLRKCNRCWKICDIVEFFTEAMNILGSLCYLCRNKSTLQKDMVVDYYMFLKNNIGPCIDCNIDDIRLLEFDHIDRNTKSICLSQARSIKELQEERPKCVSRCGICHRRRTKEQLNYNQNPNNAGIYINNVKKSIGGCVKCKWYDENLLEALEFDHIDKKTKLYNISEMRNRNMDIDLIKIEIVKCQLLCIHCHKIKTIDDNGYHCYYANELGISRNELRQFMYN